MRGSVAVVAWLALSFGAAGAPQDSRDDSTVLQDLGARWWQWRVALPEIAAPAKDASGRYCDLGQGADVWFLAGYLSAGMESASIRRTCVVPAGRRIFFPVATFVEFPTRPASIASEAAGGRPEPGLLPLCEREKAAVAVRTDAASGLFVEVDGTRLPANGLRRVATERCFALRGSAAVPAAADGYWVLLDPLPPGHHHLRYGGGYAPGSRDAGQYQDMTYDLEVR